MECAHFHYRGCWGSQGNYHIHTIPDDVRAAMDEITNGNYPVVDEKKLVLIGHSLGGWAAILAGAVDPRPRAVAALCAVTDPRMFPLNDPGYAQFFTPWLSGITPEELSEQWRDLGEEFSPLAQAKKISPRPLLIVHAETDESVSVEHSHALFENSLEPTDIHIHPDANHAFTWHRPWLRETVLNWLDHLPLV
ncbi:MAG: alpha/beta fold hydrolase [Anaerolineae bacterium]|nr:alpha/beta fold hydrolase [Anaerolineae bacterium]